MRILATKIKRSFFSYIGVIFLSLTACDSGPGAEEHFERARAFYQKGDLSSAAIEFKNTLQKAPDHAEARWLLGDTYIQLGDGAGAEKELRHAQALGRTGPEVLAAMSRALLLQGKYEDVVTKLLNADGGDGNLLALRGHAQLGLGKLDQAKADFVKALNQTPRTAPAHRGLAKVALATEDVEEAGKQLDLVLEIDPEDLEAWLLRGEMELARRQYEQARDAFQRALAIQAESAAANIGLTRALLGLEETQAAEKHIEQFASVAKEDPRVDYLRALAARQREDFAAAQEALQRVLRRAPDHVPSRLMMAAIQVAKRELTAAEESLVRFLETQPGHLAATKLLAGVRVELKTPQRALDLLRPALEKAPEDPELLALAGSALMNLGEFDQAVEYLERAAMFSPDTAAIRTRLAVGRLATGDTDQAVSELESVAALDPSLTRADLLLILVHIRTGNPDKALDAARSLAESAPEDPVPVNLMGAALEAKADYAGARERYEKALAMEPDFHAAAFNLARLALRDKDVDGARAQYESVLAKQQDHPKALVELARLAIAEGQTAEAVKLLERARDGNPKAVEPRLLLADYHLRNNRPEEALIRVQEANDIAPRSPRTVLALANAQFAAGKVSDALASYRLLTELQPRSPEAYYRLGVAQRRAGDLSASRDALKKALVLQGDYLPARLVLGSIALGAGEIEEAMATADEVIRQRPNSPLGYSLKGDVLLKKNDAQAALSAYEKAFEIAPSNALVLKVHRTRLVMGDTVGAGDGLKSWLADHPEDQAVRLVLGGFHIRYGNHNAAIAEYQKVLEAAPRNVLALNNLAWLYQETGDERALSTAELAYEVASNSAEVADTYGWLLVQRDRVDEGLPILERAAEAAPKNLSIRYHWAVGLARSGEKARARREIEKLLENKEDAFPEREEARALLQKL